MSKLKTILIISGIILVLSVFGYILDTITTTQPPTTERTPIIHTVPTPKPTYEQRIHNAINLDGSVVTFDAKTGKVAVTYYAGEQINYDSGVLLSKMHIFDIEKAIWTDGLHAVTVVEVHITSDLIDAYGHKSIGDIARAILTKETASFFVWENLDQDSAWSVYDQTWLLPNNG